MRPTTLTSAPADVIQTNTQRIMSTIIVRVVSLSLLVCALCFVAHPIAPIYAAGDFVGPLPATEGQLDNPLGENKTVQDVIVLVISYLLGILGVVALAMVVYGGLQYVYSAGNSERLQKAKETILWALIGVAIVILSLSIMRFVISAFSS